jgi:hypothetical protein
MVEAIRPPKRRLLQEQRCITSQKEAFFIVTAMKALGLTRKMFFFEELLPASVYMESGVNVIGQGRKSGKERRDKCPKKEEFEMDRLIIKSRSLRYAT